MCPWIPDAIMMGFMRGFFAHSSCFVEFSIDDDPSELKASKVSGRGKDSVSASGRGEVRVEGSDEPRAEGGAPAASRAANHFMWLPLDCSLKLRSANITLA